MLNVSYYVCPLVVFATCRLQLKNLGYVGWFNLGFSVLLRRWPRLSVNSAGDHLNSTVIINSNHRAFKVHLNLWCRKLPLYILFSPNYSFPVRFRWQNTFTDLFICNFDLAATSVTLRWVPWGILFVALS